MKNKENFLEKIPCRADFVKWQTDGEGIVTLEIENKGFFNRLAQKLLAKPKVSYVHLDNMGSFVWLHSDGEKNVMQIGSLVEEHFGEAAHPLYQRLSKYFAVLESYGFVTYVSF